jgi:hypothetical protein
MDKMIVFAVRAAVLGKFVEVEVPFRYRSVRHDHRVCAEMISALFYQLICRLPPS